MSKQNPPVGIIAEDDCDVASIRVLIHRIAQNSGIGMRQFVGKGCGKIMRKCNAWAKLLKTKGCCALIVIHDLDKNDLNQLRTALSGALAPNPFKKSLICIPVEELEAWLLSDPAAIQAALSLPKRPKVSGVPEQISSPKEYLQRTVHIASSGERMYLNTVHNEKICAKLSIESACRCPSFRPFHDFVLHTIRR